MATSKLFKRKILNSVDNVSICYSHAPQHEDLIQVIMYRTVNAQKLKQRRLLATKCK